jgi:hypothetical protein
LTLVRVDAVRGTDVAGPRPDPLTGSSARLHGWSADGSAVVSLYHVVDPAPDGVGHAWHDGDTFLADAAPRLLAVRPAAAPVDLVALPPGARHVEIAHNLLTAGRFGGPAPSFGDRVVDWLGPNLVAVAVLTGLVGVGVGLVVRRRRATAAVRRERRDAAPRSIRTLR